MTRVKQESKEITAEDLSPDPDVAEEDTREIEDVECVVNVIAPLDGDPDGHLEQILNLLRQEESSRSYSELFPTCPTLALVKQSCEEKMEADDQAADEIREKLTERLHELPNEVKKSVVWFSFMLWDLVSRESRYWGAFDWVSNCWTSEFAKLFSNEELHQ